jgi:hypothetical protein
VGLTTQHRKEGSLLLIVTKGLRRTWMLEPLGLIKCWDILEHLHNLQILEKDSAIASS